MRPIKKRGGHKTMDLDTLIKQSYLRTIPRWGGVTIDLATLEFVPDGIDAYAVTINSFDAHEAHSGDAEVLTDDYDIFRMAFMAAWLCILDREDDPTHMGIFHDA